MMSDGVDFRPMDKYMSHVCETIASEGAAITRIFPAYGEVLVQFVDRVATDVVSCHGLSVRELVPEADRRVPSFPNTLRRF